MRTCTYIYIHNDSEARFNKPFWQNTGIRRRGLTIQVKSTHHTEVNNLIKLIMCIVRSFTLLRICDHDFIDIIATDEY